MDGTYHPLIDARPKKTITLDLNGEPVFSLDLPVRKEISSQIIRNSFKKMHPSNIERILDEMFSQLSDIEPVMHTDEEDRCFFMNRNEFKALVSDGQVVGSHSHNQWILSTLTPEESLDELKKSKDLIEQHTAVSCVGISYPNGTCNDYNHVQKRQLRELGYRCAFTQRSPFNHFEFDCFEYPRIHVMLKQNMPVFEATLCGIRGNSKPVHGRQLIPEDTQDNLD